ncbi:UbiH/UbiF family hydroxylase [Mangrovicoccus algicola]|uniref:UbiH/UbiF family hydroxylase n=1 Tax=Mangrovicoccus algicola TaxID=2771008 RepID=A0A8J6Z9S9_9RHOB|nr:UbiH/UbiF family hydroxylase [Mangrovicoccus algicola]MBE3638666.1 UbiH/UbiF family hydroxylase [Mangrovicoccus algicola]
MTRQDHDIIIAGGGLAGLTAAAAFGARGLRVLCIDPAPPVTEGAAAGADWRTTAILQPGQRLLEAAGLWHRLAPEAAALKVMRIVDAGGAEIAPRLARDFDSADLGDAPFGWNLPNWLIRRELAARLAELPGVEFRPGTALADLVPREAEVVARLDDGRMVAARMAIGADGRNSRVREALGIGTRRIRYDQKALAFAVRHERPHDNVSTEIHRSGGPFTLVPLPDADGRPRSAVVWMERNAEADRLAALDPDAFGAEATARSCGLYGSLELVTERSTWPMMAMLADRFAGQRTALMAEAAHVVPPIGAQGLNMSLADLSMLLELFGDDPARLGDAALLGRYARARRSEVAARAFGVDLLNRMSMMAPQPLRDLRKAGLGLIYGISPVRRIMMRAGLGAGGR